MEDASEGTGYTTECDQEPPPQQPGVTTGHSRLGYDARMLSVAGFACANPVVTACESPEQKASTG